MPYFKFRCISKQGDTYDIERAGSTYEEARERALNDGHSLLPMQPESMTSGPVEMPGAPSQPPAGFGHILTDAAPRSPGDTRNTNQILESIDAKLSEVLRFTKLARIVLIVLICFWILGFCIWITMVMGLITGIARFGRP